MGDEEEEEAEEGEAVAGEIFIGPESDHWQCLSLTESLTHSRLVNLMPVNDAV